MDKSNKKQLKVKYKEICQILGFGAPEFAAYKEAMKNKDDYRCTMLDKLGQDYEKHDVFRNAYLTYRSDKKIL